MNGIKRQKLLNHVINWALGCLKRKEGKSTFVFVLKSQKREGRRGANGSIEKEKKEETLAALFLLGESWQVQEEKGVSNFSRFFE